MTSFNSRDLASINIEAEAVVSSHLASLDGISNDIKALESTLRKAAVPFTFIYTLFVEDNYIDSESECDGGEFFKVGVYSTEEHALVWSQTNKGARLSYNIYATQNKYDSRQCTSSSPLGKSIRDGYTSVWLNSCTPLIETKALFRLGVGEELPYFYEGIIKALKQEKKKNYHFLRSPNFEKRTVWSEPYLEDRYEWGACSLPLEVKPFTRGV